MGYLHTLCVKKKPNYTSTNTQALVYHAKAQESVRKDSQHNAAVVSSGEWAERSIFTCFSVTVLLRISTHMCAYVFQVSMSYILYV